MMSLGLWLAALDSDLSALYVIYLADDSRALLKTGTRASQLCHQGVNTADLGIEA